MPTPGNAASYTSQGTGPPDRQHDPVLTPSHWFFHVFLVGKSSPNRCLPKTKWLMDVDG